MPDNSTDTCPECGGQLATDSETGETVCSDCGSVVEEGNVDDEPEWRTVDVDWQEKESYGKSVDEISSPRNEGRLKDENYVEPEGEFTFWDHDPAIFMLTNPDKSHQEFYRIENPEEFFEGVSGEREMVEKIRENEPSQTVELPYIDWGFGAVL